MKSSQKRDPKVGIMTEKGGAFTEVVIIVQLVIIEQLGISSGFPDYDLTTVWVFLHKTLVPGPGGGV